VLVGVDVSIQTLLRRLGPKRLRWLPTPDRVIDWDAVAPFGSESTDGPATVQLRRSHEALHRLRPGELADLLEDLGRPARQELLASLPPGAAADALEEMDPDELEGLLRESAPGRAAVLVAAMESDEAADALRDLSGAEREELLDRIPAATRERLLTLLGFPEDRAGGFMTTRLLLAGEQDTVAELRTRLAAWSEHRNELDAVVVCDGENRVLADIPLFDLLIAAPEQAVAELLCAGGHLDPVGVGPDADVDEVAAALVESRRSSLLVIDDDRRPLGRILADDVVDALTPDTGRRHFPRLLR
jgi:Mg/Co/Ni transporter MgtE